MDEFSLEGLLDRLCDGAPLFIVRSGEEVMIISETQGVVFTCVDPQIAADRIHRFIEAVKDTIPMLMDAIRKAFEALMPAIDDIESLFADLLERMQKQWRDGHRRSRGQDYRDSDVPKLPQPHKADRGKRTPAFAGALTRRKGASGRAAMPPLSAAPAMTARYRALRLAPVRAAAIRMNLAAPPPISKKSAADADAPKSHQ